MINNSINVNKANNHLSPLFTGHKQVKTMTYEVGNLGPGTGTKMCAPS